MWTHEDGVETTAAPEAIWMLWADVEGWPSWNGDIEHIEIDGPFATGHVIAMTPVGQERVRLRIAEVSENELFVDEAEFGEVLIRTIHRIDRVDDDHVRVVYRMEISGAGADEVGPQLGPQISADFPQTLTALAQRAEQAQRAGQTQRAQR
jgi:hypothetical protein